jgi:ferredoxin
MSTTSRGVGPVEAQRRPLQRLEVDWTRCDGHGLCAVLLPGRIARDEWGFPVISASPVRAAEQLQVRRAIGVCPALALRLEESK